MSQLRKPPRPSSLEEAHQVIDELWSVVEDLRQQVEELTARIGKSSRNSSRPPSSDSQSQRAKRRRRKKSSRSQGAQPGHKRNERSLDPESSADAIERCFPEGGRW
ncbi:MAG: hypothetical protein CSB44_03665 [Gammaproteobacteria bacterium]|nr:MAG: hypothetical protein CSB44_03665 [Gammaproteobacteria bacterium]